MKRFLLPLLFAIVAAPLDAHEIGVMQVDGTFRKDGTYVIDLTVDLEHLPAQAYVGAIADGARVVFDGIPVKRVDAILNTEARVV